MGEKLSHSEYRSGAIASIVTAEIMPQDDVSPRTQATREIGACTMLNTLMSGDLTTHGDDEVFLEFLSRVMKNAERQGIEL